MGKGEGCLVGMVYVMMTMVVIGAILVLIAFSNGRKGPPPIHDGPVHCEMEEGYMGNVVTVCEPG